jgi:hypothetical protein
MAIFGKKYYELNIEKYSARPIAAYTPALRLDLLKIQKKTHIKTTCF